MPFSNCVQIKISEANIIGYGVESSGVGWRKYYYIKPQECLFGFRD
jgi:hypothetical protein